MESNEKHDIEIGNVESYTSDTGEYSHSTHIDICIKKCIVAGSKELCEGYNETTTDRHDNIKVVYKEDTRKAFIESVKTCKMVMICDFDDDAEKSIKKLIKKIKEKQDEYLKKQTAYWNGLDYNSKEIFFKKIGTPPSPDFFHTGLDYWNLFIETELNIYREIFEELMFLSKRLNHFKTEDFEA